MKLLVSCCNENGGLFIVDTTSGKVSRQTPKHYTSGRTGLTRKGNIVYSAGPSDIYSYQWGGDELRSLNHWSGFTDWDIHDIKCFEDHLYVVQTGGNCIVKISIDGSHSMDYIWRLDTEEDKDIVHVNSLLVGDEFLIASRFTPNRQKRPWREVAGEGDIQLLGKRIGNIAAGLFHPHSLCWAPKGELHYLESYNQTLKAKPLKGKARTIIELSGYPRGLFITKNHYYVGNSKTTNHQGINSKLDKPSVVEICRKTLQTTREFKLDDAIEIYDIIKLED